MAWTILTCIGARQGLAEVPTIYIPGLSEAQKRALRIADNKIALGAGWDLDVLKMELAELGSLDLDFDLSVTGFSTGELDVILNGSTDPDDEVIPKVPASPRTRLGDMQRPPGAFCTLTVCGSAGDIVRRVPADVIRAAASSTLTAVMRRH
jgi:hypothetical protein